MKFFKIILLCFMLVAALPAQANKDALAKAQFMLRQMNAQLNQLRSTQQVLLAEKSQLEKDNAGLQKKYAKSKQKSAKNKTTFKGKFANLKKSYKDEMLAHAQTRLQLEALSSENKKIAGIAQLQIQKIELCAANNKKLFDIDQQLLLKFEDKGVWDSMLQAEPFSQLSQVEIENLVDDYQYNMDDLRIKKGR